MIKECLPKVGIKLLKISYVRTLFLISLLFCSSDQSLLSFLNFKFFNILVLTIKGMEMEMEILFKECSTTVLSYCR